jgi:hypothetical protein
MKYGKSIQAKKMEIGRNKGTKIEKRRLQRITGSKYEDC